MAMLVSLRGVAPLLIAVGWSGCSPSAAPVAPPSPAPPTSTLPTVAAAELPAEEPFVLENHASLLAKLKEIPPAEQPISTELMSEITPFFKAWGQQDGGAAVAFAQTLPETLITPSTLAVLSGWATKDFPNAFQWTSRYETDGHEKVFYLAALAQAIPSDQAAQTLPLAEAWSAIDPAAANEWLLGLPTTPTNTAALTKTLGTWAKQDISNATNFLATLPKGRSRDQAILAMLPEISQQDPSAADKWRQELSQPTAH